MKASLETVVGYINNQCEKLAETRVAKWLGRQITPLVDKFPPLHPIAKVSCVAVLFLVSVGVAIMSMQKKENLALTLEESKTEFEKTNQKLKQLKKNIREMITAIPLLKAAEKRQKENISIQKENISIQKEIQEAINILLQEKEKLALKLADKEKELEKAIKKKKEGINFFEKKAQAAEANAQAVTKTITEEKEKLAAKLAAKKKELEEAKNQFTTQINTLSDENKKLKEDGAISKKITALSEEKNTQQPTEEKNTQQPTEEKNTQQPTEENNPQLINSGFNGFDGFDGF